MNRYHHTGDLGDVIASFPVLRELGRGEYVISDAKFPLGHGPRETLRGARFDAIQPMFEATNYITNIVWENDPKGITHDIASFRGKPWRVYETLTQWQGRHFKLNLPAAPDPWLSVDAPQHGKIVVSRTQRYHTNFFPWRSIVDTYGDDIVFVGTHPEYIDFADRAKRKIEYEPTENLLEATKIIAGSRLFIGNQSVLFWIAAGLGHKLIQETHAQLYTRNSIVPRDNAFYSDNTDNMAKIYTELELDPEELEEYPVPPPKVNLSTSAGDFRKNLSTSAEIFQEVDKLGIHGTEEVHAPTRF